MSAAVAAVEAVEVERRLFEVLGGWVPAESDPEVKLMLRAHSFQHAWHAELWSDVGRWPRLAVEVDTAVAAARGWPALYGEVLPALVLCYREALAATSAAEGPTVRALTLILADDEAALMQAEKFLLRSAAKARTIT